MVDGNAERILQGSWIVYVQRDEAICAGGLEKLRDVTSVDGVTRLRPLILARKRKIRHERHSPGRTGVAQPIQEE